MAEQPEDRLDYQGIVKEALKDAVRRVLARVAEHGLPGDHYFYIAFRTDHPGVEVPSFLRERYPDEMTIVLQHQFWELEVTPETFSVQLTFNAARHVLRIPFAALTAFIDPSADFALRFEGSPASASEASAAPVPARAGGGSRGAPGAAGGRAGKGRAGGSSGKIPRRGELAAAPASARQKSGPRSARSTATGDAKPVAPLRPVAPGSAAPASPTPAEVREKGPAAKTQPEKEPPAGGKSGDVIRFDPSRRR